jgi:hypothetical protein
MAIRPSTRQGKNVLEYQPEVLIAQEKREIPISTSPNKIHIELYLQAKGVKIWERGGKIAFAEKKGLLFATEKEFDDLLKAY